MKRFIALVAGLLMLGVSMSYAKGPMAGSNQGAYRGGQSGVGIQKQDRQRIHTPGTGLNQDSSLPKQDRLRQRIHTPGTGLAK